MPPGIGYPSKDGKRYPTLQAAAAADRAFAKRTAASVGGGAAGVARGVTKAAGRAAKGATRTVTMLIDPTGQLPPMMAPPEMQASPLDPTVGPRIQAGQFGGQAAAPSGYVPGMEDMRAFEEQGKSLKAARHPLEDARAAALAEIMGRGDEEFYGYLPGSRTGDPGAAWNFGGQQVVGARPDPYLPGGPLAPFASRGYADRPMPYESTQVLNDGGSPAGPVQGPGVQASPSLIAAYILDRWAADRGGDANMTQENIDFLRNLR